jgi:alpha-beta hydrolase superfamily lysophospholipase
MYSPLYTAIVLRPDRNDSKLYAIDKILDGKREEYYFDSRGSKLHGWLFRKPGSTAIVVVHHGNAGNIVHRLHIAKACLTAGASVFLYDYRGYGKSGGTATISGILEDGLAAEDFILANLQFPVTINYGESIGSAVACHVNASGKANALILQSGIASLPHVAKDGVAMLNVYPDLIWPQPQLDNCLLLSKSKVPLLLMHGERDKIVPASNSGLLFGASAAPSKTMIKLPHCGHNDVGHFDPDLYQNAISQFVKDNCATKQ